MKTLALALSATLLFTAAAPAAASANVEATKACLADSTTGKDRKTLGKWVFLAIAAHPEISSLSAASPAAVEQSNRDLAALFMRLVTEDCQVEMATMLASDGSQSIKVAFEYLGQIAMQELMSHQAVNGRISEFEQHIDQAKLQAALQP